MIGLYDPTFAIKIKVQDFFFNIFPKKKSFRKIKKEKKKNPLDDNFFFFS